MNGVKTIQAGKYNSLLASALKEYEELKAPEWISFVKSGYGKQRPIEERALQTVNGGTGEALGKLYVEKMFPAEAKVKAEKMIKNVIKAYQIRINN